MDERSAPGPLIDLWVDDLRPPPQGWTWAKTAEDAMVLLQTCTVRGLELDYHLGTGNKTGFDLLLWMKDHHCWPLQVPSVHTSDPARSELMSAFIQECFPLQADTSPPDCGS